MTRLASASIIIRPYRPEDQESWLRTRVLGFLRTDYFDDVWTRRPDPTQLAVALVAVVPSSNGEQVVGLLDVEVAAELATIDCIAVHPDFQRLGLGRRLLEAALDHLKGAAIKSLDAWTREDMAANAWYLSNGFTENYRYLHVYLSHGDSTDGFTTPDGLSQPMSGFFHAAIEQEPQMRGRFTRVHVCRQYVRAP